MALKGEAMGLAISTELPLVIVDVQRAGPSTGMPTKVEQSDLLSSIFGRNGDAPMPVVAISKPSDAFELTIDACRHRGAVHDARHPALGQLHRQRRRAVGAADLDSLSRSPCSSPSEKARTSSPSARREARAPLGQAGHAGHGVPDRRPGEGPEQQHQLRPGQPPGHDRHARTRRSGSRRLDPAPPRWTAPIGRPAGPAAGAPPSASSASGAWTSRAAKGRASSRIHLTHVWPLPHGLDEIFSRFKSVIVPEMNVAQMTYPARRASGPRLHPLQQGHRTAVPRAEDRSRDQARPRQPREPEEDHEHDRHRSARPHEEGLRLRPGGALVPPAAGTTPSSTALQKLMAELRRGPRQDRVRVRDRLLQPLPVLHEHLRLPHHPRSRARRGHGGQGREPGPRRLGRDRRRRLPVHRRQPPRSHPAPQRRREHPAVQQRDLRPDQGPVLPHLPGGHQEEVHAHGLRGPPLRARSVRRRRPGHLRGPHHRPGHEAHVEDPSRRPPRTRGPRSSRSSRTA